MFRQCISKAIDCITHFPHKLNNILLCVEIEVFQIILSLKTSNFHVGSIYLLTYILTYLLTPWCRVLLEQPTGLQLVKKFPAFHGTRRFITALTSVRHLSLSWASPIQSTYPHPTSWRYIPVLSTYLRLGFPSGLFPSCFTIKTLYAPLSSPIRGSKKISFIIYFTLYIHGVPGEMCQKSGECSLC